MTGRRISGLVLGIALVVALGSVGVASLADASTPGAAVTASPVSNVEVSRDAPSSSGPTPVNFWLASAQGNV